MLADKKTNVNIGVGLGFVLQLLGRFLSGTGGTGGVVGLLLMLVGLGLFVWGCMSYAEGKGHSKALGLLGLLSCIGLIILVCLPDKHPDPK